MKWSDAKKIINSNPEVLKELKKNKRKYNIIEQRIQRKIKKARLKQEHCNNNIE